MPTVKIIEKGCRGCEMCVEVCPGDVFDRDASTEIATVARTGDCIGCFSCYYQCPSQCIEIGDCDMQRPFYRIEENVAFVEKFLQIQPASTALTMEDWDEAYKDVTGTIISLAKAMAKTMGRGTKAIGRRSGTASAAHLPEIYEEKDLDGVMGRLQKRFQHCFDFEFDVGPEEVALSFKPCGLFPVVTQAGEKVGEAVACQLFHDYLAGLVSAYTGINYRCLAPEVGANCRLQLEQV